MIDSNTTLNIIIGEKTLSFGKIQSVNFLNPGSGTITVELPNQDEPYDRESVAELINACGKGNVTLSLSGDAGNTDYLVRLSSVTFNAIPQWETMIIKAQYQ